MSAKEPPREAQPGLQRVKALPLVGPGDHGMSPCSASEIGQGITLLVGRLRASLPAPSHPQALRSDTTAWARSCAPTLVGRQTDTKSWWSVGLVLSELFTS